MLTFTVILGALAALSAAGTVVSVSRDGYGRRDARRDRFDVTMW